MVLWFIGPFSKFDNTSFHWSFYALCHKCFLITLNEGEWKTLLLEKVWEECKQFCIQIKPRCGTQNWKWQNREGNFSVNKFVAEEAETFVIRKRGRSNNPQVIIILLTTHCCIHTKFHSFLVVFLTEKWVF